MSSDPENTSKAQDQLMKEIFDKASLNLQNQDLQDVCTYFVAYLEKHASIGSTQLLEIK